MDRSAPTAALAPGLRAGHVARLLGLWYGQLRRFRLPRYGRSLLGVLALRLGQKIAWDAAQMLVPGVPDAAEIIHGTYRKGWEVA